MVLHCWINQKFFVFVNCDGLCSVKLQIILLIVKCMFLLGQCVVNKSFSMLWHQRLEHISIKRIKRLLNDEVLSTLYFVDFETYVDCIKGNQTNK